MKMIRKLTTSISNVPLYPNESGYLYWRYFRTFVQHFLIEFKQNRPHQTLVRRLERRELFLFAFLVLSFKQINWKFLAFFFLLLMCSHLECWKMLTILINPELEAVDRAIVSNKPTHSTTNIYIYIQRTRPIRPNMMNYNLFWRKFTFFTIITIN